MSGQGRLHTSLKTPSGSFSSVVAVSQGAVNSCLEVLFLLEPEIGHVKFKAHDGSIDAHLRSGQVMFPVTENNAGMVYYYCIFESGTVTLWDDEEGDSGGFGDPIDVTGWKFVFSVNMSKINVPSGTDEHKQVKEVFNQPGDYSISRLYLDFNTARIASFDEHRSSFGSFTWHSTSQRNSFVSLMLRWGDPTNGVMSKPQRSTFGYAADTDTPEDVNTQAPSFPPTALMFQTYPFVDEGSTERHDGLDGRGDRNMLLYLEMTQNQAFPVERSLAYSGNFAAAGMGGTICISRDVFWDRFLLRGDHPLLLRVLNETMFAWTTRAEVDYNGVSASIKYASGVGPGSGLDAGRDFYAWDRTGGTTWEWKKHSEKKDDEGWPGVFDGTIEVKCDSTSAISATPGTNVIDVAGSTRIGVKVNTHTLGIGEGFEAVAEMPWSLAVTLDSVLDGGLKISLNLPSSVSSAWPIKTYQDSWPLDFHAGEANKLKGQIASSLARAPFQQAERELQSALNGAMRFVLPGAKTFFYKNAVFNNNADLLLELSYNGAS